jgi:hypothetical protein
MTSRTSLVALVLLLGTSAAAAAGPRDDALEAVAKCAGLSDDHARLSCYDAAAASVKSALAVPQAAPQTATAQAAPPPKQPETTFGLPSIFAGGGQTPQTTPQQFGSETVPKPPPPPEPPPANPAVAANVPPPPPPPPEPQELDSIAAGVSDYAFNPFGRFTVFLDNGQIWQQVEGDTDKAHFDQHGPNKVTISRGIFGSYGLRINEAGIAFKVKRLK